jgi:hypothetical protein
MRDLRQLAESTIRTTDFDGPDDAGELDRSILVDACIAAANELIDRGYCSTNGLITLDLLRYRIAVIISVHMQLAGIMPKEARP